MGPSGLLNVLIPMLLSMSPLALSALLLTVTRSRVVLQAFRSLDYFSSNSYIIRRIIRVLISRFLLCLVSPPLLS